MTREEWEAIVDHIIYKEDSQVVLDARKKLFMRLYDDYYDNRAKKLQENENCADGSGK